MSIAIYTANGENTIKCRLSEAFYIKGNVKKGLIKKYLYQIIIGSPSGESLVAEGLKASEFEGNGYKVTLEDDYVAHASPYGDGKVCYIKVIGFKEGGLITDSDRVEYDAYINLYGALLPKFDISIEKTNPETADFADCAVKGFTAVTAKIRITEKNYGAKINSVQFTGGVFSKLYGVHQPDFDAEAEEYSVTIDPIETAGEIYVFANVTTNYGYSSSNSTSFKVLNYSSPTIQMTIPPVRYSENDDGTITEIKQSGDGNKEKRYPFKFGGVIQPCEIKTADGEQICRIKSIDKNAVIKRVNDSKITRILLTVEDDKFSFSGFPIFEDDDAGTEIFSAYDIGIICMDSSGKEYTLVYRMNTLGTAFHLRKGGNGAKFGGYSTEEDTVESAWDIHGEKDIIADENIVGNMFRIKTGIYFGDADGLNHYDGVGTGERQFAQGNHSHGNISSTGYLIIDGEAVTNVILATNDKGEIVYIQKLSAENIYMGYDADVQPAAGIDGVEVTIGSEGSGLCYTDHVHPYSDAWKQDSVFKSLVETVDNLYKIARAI